MPPFLRIHKRSERLSGLPLAGVLLGVFAALNWITRLLCTDSVGNTSIWPPNGALLVGMLLLRGRVRVGFLLIAFAYNFSVSFAAHHSLRMGILLPCLNFGLCALTAAGARRWCGAALDLTRPRRLVAFMLVATGAALVEASLGLLLSLGGDAFPFDTFVQWTFCDAMGLILATPALLILLRPDRYGVATSAGALERCLQVVAAIAIVLATAAAPRTPILFLLFPVMLGMAFRSSPAWLLTSLLAVAMALTALTTHGYGTLAILVTKDALLRQSVIQPFLATLMICSLLPSNVLREKRRTIDRMSRLHRVAKLASERAHGATEEALAANAAKSDFLANMSHEIRTPLNGVVAVADLLTKAGLPEREHEMAEIIRASGDTLQRLLSDILDMARIESGKITIESAPFHAGDMVRSVAGLCGLRCDEKGVALSVEIAPEIDQLVMGDMVRVRQVVTNLLSNAVKFTTTGDVRLSAERLADGRARFSVRDTGVGFDMADKAKVLGRFQQADTSITRRFGGSGLGLSICANLAELMGGALDCSSHPGEGALFWLELPLEPFGASLPLAPIIAHPAPAAGPPDSASLPEAEVLTRVLVVDDHPTNRQVVKLMLDGLAELTCAEDGSQAVDATQLQSFDVILMDMQMPVMDGLTATRLIRQRELSEGRAHTPIIMLTANALPEHIASALAAGADRHLAKPFTPETLFAAMDEVLSVAEKASSSKASLAA